MREEPTRKLLFTDRRRVLRAFANAPTLGSLFRQNASFCEDVSLAVYKSWSDFHETLTAFQT